MKIFDYKCSRCGHTEERMVKQADTVVACSKCNYRSVRMPSAPGFKINGGGVYNERFVK